MVINDAIEIHWPFPAFHKFRYFSLLHIGTTPFLFLHNFDVPIFFPLSTNFWNFSNVCSPSPDILTLVKSLHRNLREICRLWTFVKIGILWNNKQTDLFAVAFTNLFSVDFDLLLPENTKIRDFHARVATKDYSKRQDHRVPVSREKMLWINRKEFSSNNVSSVR